MIVVSDKYTNKIRDLQETMQRMDIAAKIVVWEDDGFLPDEILSPYEYFVYKQNHENYKEKELFYDFLKVPEFWEIRSTDIMHGTVYDMSCKKADIYFKEPIEKKSIQRVAWCMESGWIYKIDYYNKYALKYASEFLDMDGSVESKVFYSSKNQEVIVEQPVNDTITLLENGKTKALFSSYTEFIEYYLKKAGEGEKRILFIQNKEGYIFFDLESGNKDRWESVLFSNQELLDQYVRMGGKNGYRFYFVPEEYPANRANGEALILTATDQLEGIEYLIQELPEFMFHIAASTQVSEKLRTMGEQPNVKVYPQINMQDLNILWMKCDFYLDINYYWEVYDAIKNAHQRNLLVMGFENTLHHRELVADECIFPLMDVKEMVLTMKGLVNNRGQMQEWLVKQQGKLNQIWDNLRDII